MSALTTVILLVLAYGAIVIVSTVLSQPLRVRLQGIGLDLLENPRFTDADRQEIEWLMSSSSSSVIGLMMPVAAVFMLAGSLLGARPAPDPRTAKLRADPRYNDMAFYYVSSIMACSPFATLVALPFIMSGLVVTALRGNRSLLDAAEAPAMKASAHFQPGRMQAA